MIFVFLVSSNTRSLMKKEGCPLWPPKIIYFCKFRLKRVWNYVYLACKIQNFLRLKRVWNYAYLACKIQNFLRQGGAAPLQPLPGGQPPGPPWTPRASAQSPRFASQLSHQCWKSSSLCCILCFMYHIFVPPTGFAWQVHCHVWNMKNVIMLY